MKKLFNVRPLPTIGVAVVLGILVVGFGGKIATAVFAVLAVMMLGLAIFYTRLKRRALLATVAIIGCVSMTITWFCINSSTQPIEGQGLQVCGRICADNDFAPDGSIIFADKRQIVLDDVSIDGNDKSGKVIVRFDLSPDVTLRLGDEISFYADVYPFRAVLTDSSSMSYYNDGVRYKAYYSTLPYNQIFVSANRQKTYEKIQLKCKSVLYSACNDDTAEFIFAMTFGNSGNLDQAIVDSFRATGTAHLFAVSGLHVGIIAGSIMLLLSRVPIHKLLKSAICIGFLTFFCYLTGWSPSALRATTMIAVGLVASSLGYRNDVLSTVSLAAIILLLFRPLWLFDLGFLMSFGAVFGIITLSRPLTRAFGRLGKTIGTSLAVTIAAILGLLPITLTYFGQISLIGVVANLMILPVVAIVYPLALLLMILTMILTPMQLLLSMVAVVFNGIISFVKLCAQVNIMVVDLSSAWYVTLPYFAFLFFVSDYCLVEMRPKNILVSILAATCIVNSVFGVVDAGLYQATIDVFGDGYTSIALVTDNRGTAVLLIEGTMDKDCRELVDRYCDCRRLNGIDCVAIADADSFSEYSAAYLVQCMEYWQCDKICLYGGSNFYRFDVTESDSCRIGSIFVDVSRPRFAQAVVDGVKVSLSTTNLVDAEADIVVDPPADYALAQGQYGVSDYGYVKGMKNYLPSQFTFRIKNANIIKDYTWGFIG
ncbi:MAG: ComEC/Rec2 family competence protein [Christensenellales bacterium]